MELIETIPEAKISAVLTKRDRCNETPIHEAIANGNPKHFGTKSGHFK